MRNRLRLCFPAMNLGLVEAVDRSRGVESLDAWMRESGKCTKVKGRIMLEVAST